ncbi:Asp-tRNA(Asn)/Glu-tRNA(Gln) amidotransferase subunit GatA [Desulfoprunum benzoelyticum]|uniref:Glutamyl-tRNA(Gln) amidotransferase subunit A n=1 Tax=Desulfoprunum benzoelyticum TaxID=1506996 RepID=A0A840V103_9BACT|nr:Asp-tRNA(Asn)/Glu-tRNA(Gln) amidotransferase subunit GatA [Desulfoprunum benzoelyticum]MBB5347490.1 aspartyl-tRNA(Asn)/glutamyl-tRNA(Gln) amidotransferase subunit A [Desulfoprunum benzoelyticum]MBM9529633.1 Asp-tRNA(Asn)/Glu-tRNA(Gln) amidotransferase subunit GatA [Desulfoprunum benzoelyticum]
MNLYELTVAEAMSSLAAGDITSEALTRSCLDRIDKVDGEVGAFITLDREGALEQARKADIERKRERVGTLCGIPVAIKDLLCTKDMRTTCGSQMLADFIPPYDATVVEKIKGQGGVILGKVSMDEFAMGSTSESCAFGVPQNPWKKGYVAGGSSGGSAAAVSAGECLASLGSDTGGSIRQPASLCGVIGMKPTYGRVSRYGLVAFASSLDQVGPLCRDVTDCAILMNAISGHDQRDSTSVRIDVPDFTSFLKEDVRGLRIGVPREYFSAGLHPQVERVVRSGIDLLRQAGAVVVDITLPHTEYCVAAYYLIAPAEASSNLARYDGVNFGRRDMKADTLMSMYKDTRSAGFGTEVKRRILIGTYALSSGYYDAYYKKASQVRTMILRDFQAAYESCDVLVSPVTPTPAWKQGENSDNPLAVYLSDILTISANLAGIPGISVPGGFSSDGLPIGIQIQGRHFDEGSLLRVAYALEKMVGVTRVPSLA